MWFAQHDSHLALSPLYCEYWPLARHTPSPLVKWPNCECFIGRVSNGSKRPRRRREFCVEFAAVANVLVQTRAQLGFVVWIMESSSRWMNASMGGSHSKETWTGQAHTIDSKSRSYSSLCSISSRWWKLGAAPVCECKWPDDTPIMDYSPFITITTTIKSRLSKVD